MSAVWSLSGGKRTWRLRTPTSEFDPKRTFGSHGCLQSENDLVSVQEHDIGLAQNLRDHVPRLWIGGERWPGLQLPLSATRVGPLPVLTNPLNAFSSALN
jgi:hypothetical protein